jgi:hypothetical protein
MRAGRTARKKVPQGPQVYTAPNPPTGTQPELIQNLKATPPPSI